MTNRILARRLRSKLDKLRLEDEYRAVVNARPCFEYHSYATSMGGHIECGAHGGIFSLCPNRATRKG